MKSKIQRPSGISADTLLVILTIALLISVILDHRPKHPAAVPMARPHQASHADDRNAGLRDLVP